MESKNELLVQRVCSICRVPSPFVGLCVCLELFCEVCIERHYENLPQEVCRLARARIH